ncbi:MAG: twin-arginine translocase subunit TatC, partial [Thiolinea sp.]
MSDKSSTGEQELGFLAHLYELRDRLLRMVLAIGIVFVCLFPFAKDLYELFALPLAGQVPDGMISTGTIAPFLVPLKLALLAAFLVALPYVLYQFWGFVAPGLYKHEKRLAIPLLISSVLLFYLGVLFAYFILLPLIFSVLPAFVPDVATYMPDIGSYLDFAMALFMAFGIGFEMPVATILLISTGMATRESLAKKRPYVIVGAFVVGMLLTPPDVISQLMLAIPMWILFEIGLVASSLFAKQVAVASEEKAAKEAAEREEMDREFDDDNQDDIEDEVTRSLAGSGAAVAQTGQNAQNNDNSNEPAAWANTDTSAADNDDPTAWEDDDYTYSDSVDPTGLQYEENDEYRPLT